MNKYWYKNTTISSLDVESFYDKNGDGVGDFSGLKQSLKYLSGLGVDCLWLPPFFSSPNKDNGYDIIDYYSVDTRLGKLGDFVEFLEAAEELGIRVFVDLVVNHTFNQHPWFKKARKNPDSKYRNYYIWMDEEPKDSGEQAIFGDQQGVRNWEYDKEAKAYYYHTFYKHQTGLNFANPAVREEIRLIMRFWLKLGISGFRMDAVPHMMREKDSVSIDFADFEIDHFLHLYSDTEYKPDNPLFGKIRINAYGYRWYRNNNL